MSRVYMATELEGVATFWRIWRRDGVALGFTSHDRDLSFGGIRHRAAPGMLPSAIRRSRDFELDSAEVQGALAHDAISAQDLEEGRYDGARIAIGIVDWETLENAVLYRGTVGEIAHAGTAFEAELVSDKAALAIDPVPRTSPTCRARFCGKECGISRTMVTHDVVVSGIDLDANSVSIGPDVDTAALVGGRWRWIDGPQAGLEMQVNRVEGTALILDRDLDAGVSPGLRAIAIEGCDHTLATCHSRFDNSANFRGEPFLPGNDLLVRYPTSSSV